MGIRWENWEEFLGWLMYDKKLSDKSRNKEALKSRFKKLSTYYENRDFCRATFNVFISSLKESNYSPSYINNVIKIAKLWEEFKGLSDLDSYTYFRERSSKQVDTLTFEEMQSLAICQMKYRINSEEISLRHKAIILLLTCTGMRIGEVLSIEWTDLLNVGNKYAVRLRNTKNGEDRTNLVTKQVWELMQALPAKSNFVFGLATDWGFAKDLKHRAIQCGIQKPVYPHIFRHSFITEMRRQGANYEQIAPITGHKDITVLKTRYDHFNLEDVHTTLTFFNPLFNQSQSYDDICKRYQMLGEKINKRAADVVTEETDEWMNIRIRKRI